MNSELKESIGDLSKKVYKIVKREYPKKSSIIIQFNNGEIFIGCIKSGMFRKLQFDPNSRTYIMLSKLVDTNKSNIMKCKDLIDKTNPKNKLRSFNIFFSIKTKKVNICKNKIGSMGIDRCRLFDEFDIV